MSEQPGVPPAVDAIDPAPADVNEYELALIAAAHHFAESGEGEHLRGLVGKHPELLNARLKFAGPRKPSPGDQYTLLHRAAERGRVRVVAFLLDKGADVGADGGAGWTPLHVAARAGHLDVVRMLVKRGANLDARTTPIPRREIPGAPPGSPVQYSDPIPSYTPTDVARAFARDDVAEFLKTRASPTPER